jgi:hypothetical protein
MLLNKAEHPAFLYFFSTKSLQTLSLLNSCGTCLRILLENSSIDELQMAVTPGYPRCAAI